MPSLDKVVWFLHMEKQAKLRRKGSMGSQQLPEQQQSPAANSGARASGRLPVLDLANLPSLDSEGCLERRKRRDSPVTSRFTASPSQASVRTMGSAGSAKTSCSQAAASVPQPVPKNKKLPAVLVRSFYTLSYSLQPCRHNPAGLSLASALQHFLSLRTYAPPSEPPHAYICDQ